MVLKLIEEGDVNILEAKGNITLGDGALKLRREVKGLIDKGVKKIVLDIVGVTHVDSSGIGEIISSFTSAKNAGTQFRVTKPNPRIYNILELTGLNKILPIDADLKTALTSFS